MSELTLGRIPGYCRYESISRLAARRSLPWWTNLNRGLAVAPAGLHLHHRGMARTSTASSTEVLADLVDRVTFPISENGFCVLRVKARGQPDLITVIGHVAMISAGEYIQARRRLVVLVGQRKALAIAVKGARARRRWSKLAGVADRR